MTQKNLINAVRHLAEGYESLSDEKILSAVNTALGTIFSEMNSIGRASLFLSAPEILRHIAMLRHGVGESISIPLSGVAYSLKLYGSGTVTVIDGKSTVTHNFDGWGTVLRGFIRLGGSIQFTGRLAYTVRDLTFFSECESTDADKIPVLGEKRSINISDYISDFSRALSYPEDENGIPLSNVNIENDLLICPKEFNGEVRFKYKKRAPVLNIDNPFFEIPIIPEAESALVLLGAAYCIGDDEEDAANFFMKEYKRSVSRISRESFPSESGAYFDNTGWG